MEKCGQYWFWEICELVADPRPVVEHRSGGYISLDQEFLILGNAATIDRQRAVYYVWRAYIKSSTIGHVLEIGAMTQKQI